MAGLPACLSAMVPVAPWLLAGWERVRPLPGRYPRPHASGARGVAPFRRPESPPARWRSPTRGRGGAEHPHREGEVPRNQMHPSVCQPAATGDDRVGVLLCLVAECLPRKVGNLRHVLPEGADREVADGLQAALQGAVRSLLRSARRAVAVQHHGTADARGHRPWAVMEIGQSRRAEQALARRPQLYDTYFPDAAFSAIRDACSWFTTAPLRDDSFRVDEGSAARFTCQRTRDRPYLLDNKPALSST